MQKVLLTGGGGFVGSHCLNYFLKNTNWEITVLDSFRHKGTCLRVTESVPEEYKSRVKVFCHDLSVPIDTQLENLLLQRHIESGQIVESPFDVIFNLASESAVERSALDPISCLRNNYELMINMLEFARSTKPGLFIQFSTDEVYGEAGAEPHKEWSSIVPSNPYSGSKAAQEALCIAYWRTYNMPIVITNAMNLIGERQDPEKFLPKIIQKVIMGEEMPIYGDPGSIGSRIYLHAYNAADALVFLSQRKATLYSDFVDKPLARPDRYNICGDDELNNLELAQMVAGMLNKELKYKIIPSEQARAGYDRRYALDGSKLRDMGWVPPLTLRESLGMIINWTLFNQHWVI